MEHCYKNLRFTVETLMDGIKPMNTEKEKFEYRKGSISIAHSFGKPSRLSEAKTKAQKKSGENPLLQMGSFRFRP